MQDDGKTPEAVPARNSKLGYYDMPHETDGGGSTLWLTIKAAALVIGLIAFIGFVLL